MNILVIDDNLTFRNSALILIQGEGHQALGAATGSEGVELFRKESFDLLLLDLNLGNENGLDVLRSIHSDDPRMPVVMLSAEGGVKDAVEAMRLGAIDFLEKPFTLDQFTTMCARVEKLRGLDHRIQSLEQEMKDTKSLLPDMIFDFTNEKMRLTMDIVSRSAKSQASVLILGESGTGKSVLARTLHLQSYICDKPYITVSCPSLSKELLESELFGYVRGAFTGAIKDHWGKVKAAEGGTLFLDEIGDLPMEIQPKLLRLLQEREYERMGETLTRKAEVRIVTATNRDLKKRVAEGLFREDLYFRLNVINVQMPPLRDRAEDLAQFTDHYLSYFSKQCGKESVVLSDEAKNLIARYEWPGNLRELRNAIERAVILCQDSQIMASDLPMEILESMHTTLSSVSSEDGQLGDRITLAKLEEIHIQKIIDSSESLGEAAEILGIDQTTLYRKRKKMGVT